MSTLRSLAAFAALSSLSLAAHASVITFDGLAGTAMPGYTSRVTSNTGTGSTSFSANKTSSVDNYSFVDTFVHAYIGANTGGAAGQGTAAWNGTDYLRAFRTTMSSTSLFSVESVDLSHYIGNNLHVTITGVKHDGSTISRLISKTATSNTLVANDFATYALTGFTDLKSIRFYTGTSYFALDNIRIAEQNVPEPGSLAILGLGLAGFAAARRHRK